MKSFKLSTTTFNKKGLPVFLKGGLDFAQMRFVAGCEKAFKKQKRSTPNANYNFAETQITILRQLVMRLQMTLVRI